MKRTGIWRQAQNRMSLFHGAIGAEAGRDSRTGKRHVLIPADWHCHGMNHHYYQQDLLNQRRGGKEWATE